MLQREIDRIMKFSLFSIKISNDRHYKLECHLNYIFARILSFRTLELQFTVAKLEDANYLVS